MTPMDDSSDDMSSVRRRPVANAIAAAEAAASYILQPPPSSTAEQQQQQQRGVGRGETTSTRFGRRRRIHPPPSSSHPSWTRLVVASAAILVVLILVHFVARDDDGGGGAADAIAAMPSDDGGGIDEAKGMELGPPAPAAAAAAVTKRTTIIFERDGGDPGDGIIPHHRHAIPPVLIFTYHTDLLATPTSGLVDDEDVALAENVKSIISLHRENAGDDGGASSSPNDTMTVRFLNDDDCISSIRNSLGSDTNLTRYFADEEKGMYKADICRGAALYETGGLYFDVDIEARMSLWDVIDANAEFVTTYVHVDSNHRGGFFQAFIGSTRMHPILLRYLELFVDYYEGRITVGGPLGVYLLRMAYDEYAKVKKEKRKGGDEGGGKVRGAMDDDVAIDLWQEVRYTPKKFPDVTRDHWGTRRACQMLVVAPPIPGRRDMRMVPLFSHANGSRMCGGKDTMKKG